MLKKEELIEMLFDWFYV